MAVIPLHLLGYSMSVAKGRDVDKPRNLAKSVTVEYGISRGIRKLCHDLKSLTFQHTVKKPKIIDSKVAIKILIAYLIYLQY